LILPSEQEQQQEQQQQQHQQQHAFPVKIFFSAICIDEKKK